MRQLMVSRVWAAPLPSTSGSVCRFFFTGRPILDLYNMIMRSHGSPPMVFGPRGRIVKRSKSFFVQSPHCNLALLLVPAIVAKTHQVLDSLTISLEFNYIGMRIVRVGCHTADELLSRFEKAFDEYCVAGLLHDYQLSTGLEFQAVSFARM